MATLRSFGVLAVASTVALACTPAERNEAGEIETAGSVDAFAIQIGDCFDDASSAEVTQVAGVPCAEPHDNEVFATFDLGAPEWPGEEAVTKLGDTGCLKRFQPYVGTTYEKSVLMITTLTPTEGSWSQRDDREVVCVAYHMELEKLSGSVRDSRK